MCILLGVLTAGPARAISVCPEGPPKCQYSKIIDAVNAAASGDTIEVAPGGYSEPRLLIANGMSLRSTQPANPGAVTITNNDGRSVIVAASGAVIEGFTITGGTNPGGYGGGVSVGGGIVVLRNLTVEGNTAGVGGGVGGNAGGTLLTIDNCTIRNNTATSGAGGVVGGTERTTITGSLITGNTASNLNGGGVVLNTYSTNLITNSTISQNHADNGDGGGIFAKGNLTLSGVILQGNTASANGSGGGLYIGGSTKATADVFGGSITGNSAGQGGGIWTSTPASRLATINTSISGNTAAQVNGGGGLFCGFVDGVSFAGTIGGNSAQDAVGCDVTPTVGTTRTHADKEQSGTSNDPVNTRTGELYEQHGPDLDLGGPMPLRFARYYASGLETNGIYADLGMNWRHNFDWKLSIVGTAMNVVDPRGRTIQFAGSAGVWSLVGKADVPYQVAEAAGVYTLLDPRSQLSYEFDASGRLDRVSDARGNAHTLTYTDGRLAQVSDGLGRVLNFTYDPASHRVTGVDDGKGRTVGIAYTGDDLTGVTGTDGQTTAYHYATTGSLNNRSLLWKTVRPAGNTPYTHGYWSADRKVAYETDAGGNETDFAYVSPTQTTITDPLGHVRTHTHAATGELSASQDAAGQDVAIGSDAAGRRSSITDRLGDVTTMTYHAPSGKLASKTHADGTTTSYTYSARTAGGNTAYDLSGLTHADGTTEAFAHDGAGNLTSRTDPLGHTATFTHNGRGQVLTATNPLGGVTARTYNADATVATVTDPASNATTLGYDTHGRTTSITHADTTVVSIAYDPADRPLTTTDENGHTTTLAYDPNGNLAAVTDPSGNTTSFAYDGNDRLLSVTDPLLGVSSRTYDALGRVGSTTDPLGNATTFGYDLHNRLTSVTDPLANVWGFTYDLEGVIASRTDPLSNTTSFVSDKMGRITQTTSPLGHTSSLGYDPMGRVTTLTDALGQTTTIGRDAAGRLSSVALPGGGTTASYTRNALGQLTDLTDPNANHWRRAYDTAGRLTSSTDPLLQVTTIDYDNRNRPATVTYPGAVGARTHTYDGVGNLTRMSSTVGPTLGFTYDANDRLTAANNGGMTPANVTRAYDADGRIRDTNGIGVTHDAAGRLATLTLATGKVVTYAYDAAGRLTSVTDWAGGITGFTYDAAGRRTGITRPNGVDTAYTWDADSRLVGVTEGAVSSIGLTRDAVGRITAATRSVPQGATAAGVASRTDTFDAASQIVGNTYDGVGRRTGSGADSFTWDGASRLTAYTVGGQTATHTYDALGRRTSRTRGGVTRDYVWNDALGLSSISVERQGGTDRAYYVHTPGGDLLYRIDAATDARQFHHHDEMGNTIVVTDDAGAVIGTYAYTPFGQHTASTGGLDNPFTWQGRHGLMDEGNGLYYVRARFYDATVGRFISRDPRKSMTPSGVNPYPYSLDNPLALVDVTGRRGSYLREVQRSQESRWKTDRKRTQEQIRPYLYDRPGGRYAQKVKEVESIYAVNALLDDSVSAELVTAVVFLAGLWDSQDDRRYEYLDDDLGEEDDLEFVDEEEYGYGNQDDSFGLYGMDAEPWKWVLDNQDAILKRLKQLYARENLGRAAPNCVSDPDQPVKDTKPAESVVGELAPIILLL